jgi:hypothetical protein
VSNGSWVEANYRETQIGRMKVGDPVRIDAPGTAPTLLQGDRLVHVTDLSAEEAYLAGELNRRALVDFGGCRASLVVPLRKDNNFLRGRNHPFRAGE